MMVHLKENQINSVNRTNPQEGAALGRGRREAPQSVIMRNPLPNQKRTINIATWNVRTLHQKGKLEQVKNEAERLEVDVLGVAEARWTSNGKEMIDGGWELYYSGRDDSHREGVAFLVSPNFRKSITEVRPVNERIIIMRCEAKPRPINFVQVYMPTSLSEEADIMTMYAKIQIEIEKIPKRERLVVMGDFNAKIGEDTDHPACGKFGLGETNERGEILLDWMRDNSLIAVNTCFRHRRKARYTWVSPDGSFRNMIDYIIIRRKDLTETMNSRSLVSADCGSDHQMVWAKISGRSWNYKKTNKRLKRNLEILKSDEQTRKRFENALKEKMTGDQSWTAFKTALVELTEEYCPILKVPNKPWIDEHCWELMEKRRELKIKHPNNIEHRIAQKRVKKALRKAKRNWYKDRLLVAQNANRRGDTKTLHKIIKTITRKKTVKSGIGIKDGNGKMLYNINDIRNRWYEYGKQLFARPGCINEEWVKGREEPEVLIREIEAAIQKLKTGKAVGTDEVPAEILIAGGTTTVKIMKSIIDKIWHTGSWPEDWILSEIVTPPKAPGTLDCNKHRTISLICHASKVLLEILRQRLQHFIGPQIADVQFGFVQGKSTTDAILAARNMIQKVAKKQDDTELWMLFIDYSKAFDSVYHDMLWKTLAEFGTPQHLIWLTKKLYDNARGVIKVGGTKTEPFSFEKGVRQGCLISPLLFNAISERIMREVAEEMPERAGKVIGGQNVWNIRYADDTTLIANSKDELMNMMNRLQEASLKMGLKINSSKTAYMVIHGEGDISIDNVRIEQVDKFKFLGSYITKNSDSMTEIKARFGQARSIGSKMSGVWYSKELSLKLKVDLAKTLVWSVALYGCESWTLRKEEERMVQVFEMWLWRRVLGVCWKDRRTNIWVREKVGVQENEGMVVEIKKRKLRKYGHWKRREDSMVLATVEGEIEGRARRGRRKTEWIDNIREWHGGMEKARRCARNRGAYGPNTGYGELN